jgi:glycosyltransferase involved in cell wall biosynthesis
VNVLVVSGIWPPDVGGPASHAPEVAQFLRERGHRVEVVTTAAAAPAAEAYPVHWVSRRLPKGLLHARATSVVRRRAARADVVYTTGMYGRSAAGALAARTPYVVKLTSDPAFERSRRLGNPPGGAVALRLARNLELRRAVHVVCPSTWLHDLVVAWGVPEERVSVLPNPAPVTATGSGNGTTLAFAGRLTAQKSLGVALDALSQVDGVELVVAGEGPERASLERRAGELGLAGRVRFVGPRPREEVLSLFREAGATILSSSWENFPHTVVESLAVGTPVLATRTGGVDEVVEDGRNGLLVEPGDAEALAGAIRRYFGDGELRRRLRAAAATSVAEYAPDRIYGKLEELLRRAAERS